MALKTRGAKCSVHGKKGVKKNIEEGQTHISSTFNNTMTCLTDLNGNILSWTSAGQSGFRGSRESTPHATQQAAEETAKKAMKRGLKTVEVYIKGPGSGREPVIRGLQASGLEASSIKGVTPIPHDGCKPPKKRRV